MGNVSVFAARMVAILVLHAASVGFASPTVLVTRPQPRFEVEWLPNDNQTLYRLMEGESKSLELNTSLISQTPVYITISPCSRDVHWVLFYGKTYNQGSLSILKDHNGGETKSFSIFISYQDRYILKLSSIRGSAVVVSVRGEATKPVRLRLRTRSRRRLITNWDPSPIDPQATSYCVVASHSKNYTSLCEARCDSKVSRVENKSFDRLNEKVRSDDDRTQADCTDADTNNKIVSNSFGIFESTFKNVYRRRKFGRSTKANDDNPLIACVGERTHHLIENLDQSKMYYVSVFGLASDRQYGSLLATGSVKPKTSTAKCLKENVPYRADVKGRAVYYFKATVGVGGGMWMVAAVCGGAVDIEVLARGKRLSFVRNIESHSKFFVPAVIPNSSIQEFSDEGSIQFDSSSEEARMRYVIKVTPTKWDREKSVNVEVTASTTRWGMNIPELSEDGAVVRELRPKRSCRSLDVAFLPAFHNTSSYIKYCIIVRESTEGVTDCLFAKNFASRTQCFNNLQRPPTKVIIQRISGLKSGKKYAVQVTASTNGSQVRYKMLHAETNISCKEDAQ